MRKTYRKALPKLLLLVSLVTIGIVLGCIREVKEPQWTFGRVLALRVFAPELVQDFSYVDNTPGACATPQEIKSCPAYTVSSPDPDRYLAAIHMTVVNETSAAAPLLIDTEAALLEDRAGNRYLPIDPLAYKSQALKPLTKQSRFVPFLQGEYTLIKDRQIEGWVFFEVPRGIKIAAMRWNEGDDIVVTFSR